MLRESEAADERQLHAAWRQWLRVFHWAQVVRGVVLATVSGVEGYDLETANPALAAASVVEAEISAGAVDTQRWQMVFELSLPEVRQGLQALRDADAAPPQEVGFELADERGKVVAEAELAWLPQRLVVLTEAQAEYRQAWLVAGWVASDARGDWVAEVREHVAQRGAMQ